MTDALIAALTEAFIAGFEAFPGPDGQWDRKKIRAKAERKAVEYVAALNSRASKTESRTGSERDSPHEA